MKTKFENLMGKLLFLCAVLCLWGSSMAYAEEKVQSGFELMDEKGKSITDSLSFVLEDSKGEETECQLYFGYLLVDVIPNQVYTLRLQENKEYTMPVLQFLVKEDGADPIDPEKAKLKNKKGNGRASG